MVGRLTTLGPGLSHQPRRVRASDTRTRRGTAALEQKQIVGELNREIERKSAGSITGKERERKIELA